MHFAASNSPLHSRRYIACLLIKLRSLLYVRTYLLCALLCWCVISSLFAVLLLVFLLHLHVLSLYECDERVASPLNLHRRTRLDEPVKAELRSLERLAKLASKFNVTTCSLHRSRLHLHEQAWQLHIYMTIKLYHPW